MGTYLPVRGASISYYASRYVSSSFVFAIASLIINYWNTGVNSAVWISILIVLILVINLLPVAVYGEGEFWFVVIKIITITGLLFLSFIYFCGGVPGQIHRGFHYWYDPGAINHYLVGGSGGYVCAFAAGVIGAVMPVVLSPEMIIMSVGGMQSPRRNLPTAAKNIECKVVTFCDCHEKCWNPRLGRALNAAILTSALSAGNTLLYLSSRSLYSLAIIGNAPSIFKRCTKRGLPWAAVMASFLFMPLAYLDCSSSSSTVFNWLSQPWRAWACIVFFTILCLINGFDVFVADDFNASDFLTAYIGIPIFLAVYFGHRIVHWKEPWAHAPEDVDLVSGLQEVLDLEAPAPVIPTWGDRIKSCI
ncbi:hypothetical protein N7488_009486 [Penicillium malachiteum]|nr:hypothetical protein N7488_009486 [Penicillium malachiteum]